jgi:hypothetical protein
MKEALLVIDMLNDFVLEGAPLEVPAARSIIPVIRKELEAAPPPEASDLCLRFPGLMTGVLVRMALAR